MLSVTSINNNIASGDFLPHNAQVFIKDVWRVHSVQMSLNIGFEWYLFKAKLK